MPFLANVLFHVRNKISDKYFLSNLKTKLCFTPSRYIYMSLQGLTETLISQWQYHLSLLCTSHLTSHPPGIITSYSPASVSLGGGVNTHFRSFLNKSGDDQGIHIWFVSHPIFMLLGNLNIWHLEMLFKDWRGDLTKAVTADSTHTGLWFVQLSTQGQGLHSVFLPWCLGTSLAFTLTLSECLRHAWGRGLQMTSALPF